MNSTDRKKTNQEHTRALTDLLLWTEEGAVATAAAAETGERHGGGDELTSAPNFGEYICTMELEGDEALNFQHAAY